MKRQGGFTLIEMIVVIVILGILAVTAAPKFLSFENEAREASLNGLKGAMDSAASMAHGQFLIKGSVDGLAAGDIVSKYPAPTETGIGALLVVNSQDWKFKEGANLIEYTFTTNKENAGGKCAVYAITSNETSPTTSVANCTLDFSS